MLHDMSDGGDHEASVPGSDRLAPAGTTKQMSARAVNVALDASFCAPPGSEHDVSTKACKPVVFLLDFS